MTRDLSKELSRSDPILHSIISCVFYQHGQPFNLFTFSRSIFAFKLWMHPQELATFVLDTDQVAETVGGIFFLQQGVQLAQLRTLCANTATPQPRGCGVTS